MQDQLRQKIARTRGKPNPPGHSLLRRSGVIRADCRISDRRAALVNPAYIPRRRVTAIRG